MQVFNLSYHERLIDSSFSIISQKFRAPHGYITEIYICTKKVGSFWTRIWKIPLVIFRKSKRRLSSYEANFMHHVNIVNFALRYVI